MSPNKLPNGRTRRYRQPSTPSTVETTPLLSALGASGRLAQTQAFSKRVP